MENNEQFEIKERKRWLFFGLPLTFTVYTLNEKKLIIKSGFFKTIEDEILLYRIVDITFTRSLFQKMAGLGTLNVNSSDSTHPTLEIKNIKNCRDFKEAFSDAIEKERLRMRFRAGEYIGQDLEEIEE